MIEETCLLFQVDDINFGNLEATVTVKAVQNDINLHTNIACVPLVELYPMLMQNDKNLSCDVTAFWLKKLRFFFLSLWYPFDCEKDIKIEEWCDMHLDNRLSL